MSNGAYLTPASWRVPCVSVNDLPCELLAVYRLVKTRPLFRNRGGELCHGRETSKVHCSVPGEQIRRTLVLNSWYKEIAMNMIRLFSVGVVAAGLTCVSGYANASDNAIGESTPDVMLVAEGAAGSGGTSSGAGSGSMDSGKRSGTQDTGKGSGGPDAGMKSGVPDHESSKKSGETASGEKGTGMDSGKSGSAGPSSGMSEKSSGDSGTYGGYYGPTSGSGSSGTSGSGSGSSGGSGGGGK